MAGDNQSDEHNIGIGGNVEHSSVVLGDGNTVYNTTVFGSFDVEQFPSRPSQRISQQEYRRRQVLVENVKHHWLKDVSPLSRIGEILVAKAETL